ncbi:redoxin domain-containing protein [Clostridium sp.]|uniref:redoxin domain-containing protein n=1 Tax=Clostridium sp. TaxID=1506 RepID=UPI00263465B9|nr:redoxin domain-containing protein [Clostridium sp.]
MNPIPIGTDAPDFTSKDNKKQEISLSAYKGKKVLLSWHPLAWTPVCTDQMRALETNFQNFQNLNIVPLGFSVDPQPCKEAWATTLQIKNVSLPSNFWPHGKIAHDYGIFNETKGISERANIIIDENGTVQWVKVYPSEQLPDINEVLQVLASK